MHQTTSKEIIEGNLKSIMRLVLALAAHFKPTNVQPYSTYMSKINPNSNSHSSNVTPSSSSTINNNNISNKANFMINKRSHSTNNVNTNTNTINTNTNANNNNNINNNNNLNNTYVVNQTSNNQPSTSNQLQSRPSFNQSKILFDRVLAFFRQKYLNLISFKARNLDSMTHLVQAACVSLADVRRYKNENFK